MPVQYTEPRQAQPRNETPQQRYDPKKCVDGKDGTNGTNGTDGVDGVSPSVEEIVAKLIVEIKTNEELIVLLKGTDGTNGLPGTDGTADNIDIDKLVKKLPPFYPQWVDEENNVIDSMPNGVRLGEKMPLRITIDVKLIEKIVSESLARQAK